MYDLIHGRTDGLAESMISFAQNLVRIPSRSLNEGEAAAYIEKEMRELGYDKVVRDGSGNVVGVLFGRESEPGLLLNSHIDTVTPCDEETWQRPAYGGVIESGRIYGAGASDCKGGLAAQIYAGAILKKSLLPLWGNLIVSATVAEENGQSIGLRSLIAETLPDLGCRVDYAILGEPTELGLYYGHDGWAEFNIHIEGPHYFHVTDTARRISHDLRHLFSGNLDSDPHADISVGNPRFHQGDGVREADIKVSKRLRSDESATTAASWLNHEAGLMAKPENASVVSVQIMEEEQKLYTGRKIISQYVSNAWATDPYCPLIQRSRQALSAAGCEVKMGKWKLGRLGMGTAGSVLTNEFKIPTIGYGPGCEDQAHARDESVEVEKIRMAAYGTASIAHGLVGIPVCGWTSDEI